MLNQNDKIERFSEVINKSAQAQCKKIQKRADKFKKEQLSVLEKQAEQELDSRLNFELDRINAEINGEISRLQNESKLRIVERRNEITDEVFRKAGEQLLSFAKSDDYRTFLESSVRSLCCQFDSNIIILAKDEDVELVRDITSAFSVVKEVRALTTVSIGGVAALSEDETVFIDDTIDERLAAQKEWFMSSSGLSINE